jgi:hypothetical protein
MNRLSLRTLLPVLLGVFLASLASAQDAPVTEPPLPLKRVVMFSSSVGFFEHRGEIEGNRQIEFAFKTADINDLLKSLVVQDRGGGLVTAVNYGSPEPISRTLRTFAIDLTETPTLAEILQQLRGQRVKVDAPGAISGVIVGVEVRRTTVGYKETEVEVLNLRTAEGLRSVRLDDIVLTRFEDEKIDQQFQQALDLLATEHSTDQKRVKLDFRGEGKRQVAVGYIQEAPVWKTSYRLVLDDEKQPFLQGWAIVENTTPQDWKDVQLTLVSGRPISFLMDLYEPLFMSRPWVQPEQHAFLRPRVYDQDLVSREQEFQKAADVASGRRRGRSGGFFGGGGGMMGGGGMGGFGGGFGGEQPQEGRPMVTSVVPVVDQDMDLKRGVQSAASGEDVGELFRYVIQQPVTLGRNESAMLPIVNDAVKGEKVAIYNPGVHAKHPLSGLRLTNTTPLHLLQGPITLFDGGEYAGDARIEDIPPGSTRLVSYALDLETEIAVEDKPSQRLLVALSIRKGGLHIKHKESRQTDYVVKNSSDRAKQVLIERSIDPEWKLTQPAAVEKTRAAHRLTMNAEPGKTATLAAVEERDVTEKLAMVSLDLTELAIYLQAGQASAPLKQALEEAISRRTALLALQARRTELDRRLADAAAEQLRVRDNLKALPAAPANNPADPNQKASRDLAKRFLDKLASLETDLETQRQQLAELRQEEQKASEQLETFLGALIVE